MPDVPTCQKPQQVGVDVGLLRLATLSDGETFENKRPLRQELDHLAVLQRVLARKEKGSKNREDVKRKIGRLHKRIRDIRDDALHKLTTQIARNYGFVAIEDLNIEGMVKNHCLALSLQDAALGRLRLFLETKVPAQGGMIIKVDRFFPSSKTCCRCGCKRDDLSLSDRVFVCSNPECQLELDRDLNATINILNEGLRLAGELKAAVAEVAINET
jgi:putative transposase